MRHTLDKRERLFVAGLILIAATILALLFFAQWSLIRIRSGNGIDWEALSQAFSLTYVWAAVFPLILWLDDRFPIQRRRVVRSVLTQAFFSVCVNLVIILVTFSIDWLIEFGKQPKWMGASWILRQELSNYFIARPTTNFIYYWAVLGVAEAINYFRKYQDQELKLTQAQLQILKAQLEPHFLFNTLNAISELVYEHPKTADDAIVQLSSLLRRSLQNEQAQEVTLKTELEFAHCYLEIQRALMQDRLKVHMDVDPVTLDALVPNMILQPLLENAVRHGIAPRAFGGCITISVNRQNGALMLRIRDNGLGLQGKAEPGSGIGLTNTYSRLQYLYKDSHRISLTESPGGGVTVDLQIPFREKVEALNEDSDGNS